MDEVIDVMQGILDELREMNSKLDDIKGSGYNNSMSDICDKLDNIETSLDVLESSMDVLEASISSLETTIELK